MPGFLGVLELTGVWPSVAGGAPPTPTRRPPVIVRPRPEPKTEDIIRELEAETRARVAITQAEIEASEAEARRRSIQRSDEDVMNLIRQFLRGRKH